MTRYLAHGLAAGCFAATALLFHAHFLPTLYGGLYPLLFALLAGTVLFLATGRLTLPALPRLAWAGLAVAAVPLTYGLYLATARFSFLSNESGVLMFVVATCTYLLPAALPLAALGRLRQSGPGRAEPEDTRSTGMMLLGSGLALLLISVARDLLPLYLFVLPGAILAAALAMLPPPAPLPAQRIALSKRGKGKKGAQAPRILLPGLATYVEALALLFLAYLLPVILQWMSELSPGALPGSTMLPGLGLGAAGAGLFTGARLAASERATEHTSRIVALSVLLLVVLGIAQFDRQGIDALYQLYYGGMDTAGSFATSLPVLLYLPIFAVSLLGGMLRTRKQAYGEKQDNAFTAFLPAVAVATGLLAALLAGDSLPFWMLGMFITVAFALLAVTTAMLELRPGWPHLAGALVLAGAVVPLFLYEAPTYTDLFDPQHFQVSAEVRAPGGRTTLLRARDDDDPFYSVFRNQTETVTQSSRGVQSALYRMGHLPLLLAPKHDRVLLLGLGSSLPVQAIRMHAPERVVCVEADEAMFVLSDSTKQDRRERRYMRGVTRHIERIEAFAARQGGSFDVIISAEPLAVSAPSVFPFTETFYSDVSDMLSDQGLFAQWLPLQRLGTDGVWRVARAMRAVFGHVELWIATPDPDNTMIGLIATKRDAPAYTGVADRLQELKEDEGAAFHLRQIEYSDATVVLSTYGMDHERLGTMAGTAEAFDQWSVLPAPPDQAEAPRLAMDMFLRRAYSERITTGMPDSLQSAVSTLFNDRQAVFSAAMSVLAGDDSSAVRTVVGILGHGVANLEARRVLSDILQRQAAGYVGMQQYAVALDVLTRVLALTPVNTYTLRLIMIAALQTGDRSAATMAIEGIKRINPAHAGFRDNQATIRAQEGAVNDALLLYENAITMDPENEDFYCNMASFHYSQGRAWEAVRVLDQAAERSYYPAKAYFLQGGFYAESGQAELAMEAYKGYLRTVRPGDPYLGEIQHRINILKPALPQ